VAVLERMQVVRLDSCFYTKAPQVPRAQQAPRPRRGRPTAGAPGSDAVTQPRSAESAPQPPPADPACSARPATALAAAAQHGPGAAQQQPQTNAERSGDLAVFLVSDGAGGLLHVVDDGSTSDDGLLYVGAISAAELAARFALGIATEAEEIAGWRRCGMTTVFATGARSFAARRRESGQQDSASADAAGHNGRRQHKSDRARHDALRGEGAAAEGASTGAVAHAPVNAHDHTGAAVAHSLANDGIDAESDFSAKQRHEGESGSQSATGSSSGFLSSGTEDELNGNSLAASKHDGASYADAAVESRAADIAGFAQCASPGLSTSALTFAWQTGRSSMSACMRVRPERSLSTTRCYLAECSFLHPRAECAPSSLRRWRGAPGAAARLCAPSRPRARARSCSSGRRVSSVARGHATTARAQRLQLLRAAAVLRPLHVRGGPPRAASHRVHNLAAQRLLRRLSSNRAPCSQARCPCPMSTTVGPAQASHQTATASARQARPPVARRPAAAHDVAAHRPQEPTGCRAPCATAPVQPQTPRMLRMQTSRRRRPPARAAQPAWQTALAEERIHVLLMMLKACQEECIRQTRSRAALTWQHLAGHWKRPLRLASMGVMDQIWTWTMRLPWTQHLPNGRASAQQGWSLDIRLRLKGLGILNTISLLRTLMQMKTPLHWLCRRSRRGGQMSSRIAAQRRESGEPTMSHRRGGWRRGLRRYRPSRLPQPNLPQSCQSILEMKPLASAGLQTQRMKQQRLVVAALAVKRAASVCAPRASQPRSRPGQALMRTRKRLQRAQLPQLMRQRSTASMASTCARSGATQDMRRGSQLPVRRCATCVAGVGWPHTVIHRCIAAGPAANVVLTFNRITLVGDALDAFCAATAWAPDSQALQGWAADADGRLAREAPFGAPGATMWRMPGLPFHTPSMRVASASRYLDACAHVRSRQVCSQAHRHSCSAATVKPLTRDSRVGDCTGRGMPWDALAGDLEASVLVALLCANHGPPFYAGIAGTVAPADAMHVARELGDEALAAHAWLDGTGWAHPDAQVRSGPIESVLVA
jgi:hypothetical protein